MTHYRTNVSQKPRPRGDEVQCAKEEKGFDARKWRLTAFRVRDEDAHREVLRVVVRGSPTFSAVYHYLRNDVR